MCRLCGKFQESVQHIVSSCGELAKKQYTIRHDKMGSRIHWELCRKYGIICEDKWFNHVPSTVCSDDNGNIEIFWNKEINLGVPHNRPDVVVVDKEKRKWTLIDFSMIKSRSMPRWKLRSRKVTMYKLNPHYCRSIRYHSVESSWIP